jgi:MoaA/NifB/PqqE/SkfB family radical SAM enzyme
VSWWWGDRRCRPSTPASGPFWSSGRSRGPATSRATTSRADAVPHRHPDELTTSEGRALLDEAREFGRGQLVVLSGGDPLERDDLVDLVDYGTDRGLRLSLTPSGTASLTPSGTASLTTERVAALADAGLSRTALGIDGGSPEPHDRFRGEAGSFTDTVRAALDADRAGIGLQVNTTVCAETVGELPRIRDLVAALDADRWSLFFLVPVGRGRQLDPVSPDRADRVMSWLHEVRESASFDVKTSEAPQFRRVGMERDGTSPGAATARPSVIAGDGFAFVSHVGEGYPSGFLPEPAGNLRDASLLDLSRDAPLFTELRDRSNLVGKCGACEYHDHCGGSRSRAYANTGDPFGSDPLCPHVPAAWAEGATDASAD